MRKNAENRPKWQKLGLGGVNIASVSFRGRPRQVWAGDGRLAMGIYEVKQRKMVYMAETRAVWAEY